MTVLDLQSRELFASVQALQPVHPQWVHLRTWEEGRAEPGFTQWENLQLELSNQLRLLLQSESMDEYRRWNTVVDQARGELAELLHVATANRAPPEHQKWVGDGARWDLVMMRVAEIYGRFHRVPRYEEMLEAYTAGRLPCGTVGGAVDGALVVL